MADEQPVGRFDPRGTRAAAWRTDGRPAGADDQGSADGGGVGRTAVIVVGTVLAALLLAMLVVTVRENPPADDGVEASGAQELQDVSGEPPAQQAKPGIHIHPQRAEAATPVELLVQGAGCPGARGSVSITQVGSAPFAGAADRLVVRRQFDVADNWSFETRPLLVGQPPGSYRVTAACERSIGPLGVAPADEAGGRDVFLASEVLELTGSGTPGALVLQPTLATAGLATQLRLDGGGCRVVSPQVSVTFSPALDSVGAAPTVKPDGRWTLTRSVSPQRAGGVITVQAACYSGDQLQFTYATRQLRFVEPLGSCPAGDPGCGAISGSGDGGAHPVAGPAVAVPGRPSYTG